jgi:putative hydrolase of HD superfamily
MQKGGHMEEIMKIFDFMIEVEKLKGVLRKTRPVGMDRYENSAEHSWHISLFALMLKDFANEEIDIDRVIKMLLIHDLGEIYAGDTIIYKSETKEVKEKETKGFKRVIGLLPISMQKGFIELWLEFEAGETPESKYAKAIDRIPPVLHNLHGDGHSWKAHNISKEKIFTVNSRIKEGSEIAWNLIESQLNEAISKGILK